VPIYEYHCVACGEEFERLVFGQALVVCPGCDSADVARKLSLFGLRTGSRFVGSGHGCGSGCGCGAGGG
jgi:putative FmdB family regulatory protein